MGKQKERIDVLMVKKGLTESRERAKKLIMAGIVYIDTERIDKPGTKVEINSNVVVKGNPLPYVSRGGLKLEKALKVFELSVEGKKAVDIGASTGGFTDCMLQNGAKKVYAIDVGYGQLAWKLRNDKRVVPIERTNIRNVTLETIGEYVDFATIDVSFISLKLVLPVAKELLTENADIVALIKPQFEAGREKVGKKGVVRDNNVHKEVLTEILNFCNSINLFVHNISYSPIKGSEGNIEYLAHLKKEIALYNNIDEMIENVVLKAHDKL